jgi:murein L,D-transpeptidase YcbB/YkuD
MRRDAVDQGAGGCPRAAAGRGRLAWVLAVSPWLGAGVFGVTGCDSGSAPREPVIPQVAGEAPPPAVAGAALAGATPGAQVAAPAAEGDIASQIQAFHKALAAEEAVAPGAQQAPAPATDDPFATAVASRVTALEGRLVFFSQGELTPAGERFLATYRQVDTQGFDPARLDVAGLEAAVKAWTDAREAVRRGTQEAGGPAEQAVRALVAETRGKDADAIEDAVAAKGLDGAAVEAALATMRERFTAEADLRREAARAMVAADRALLSKLHRYACEMRFARWAHPFRADRTMEAGVKRAGDALVRWLDGFFKPEGLDLDGLLAAAAPAHPDYARTVEALARYRQLAKRFPAHLELGKDAEKLRRGRNGPAASKLAERLKQEGYFDGEVGPTFGADLEAAVIAYQQTHQIKDSGEVDKVMRQSLNKPYAERADQLALSLQRLRESDLHQGEARFGEAPMRIRVNIPAFEATFFQGREEARRHRVIVGNNNGDSDARTGKRGKMNQTRLFSAEMSAVVLNPTWNVPRRIKEQELDLLLMEQPDYYAKHNFEVKVMPDGSEVVVQQPGSGNALGVVKFLFPNEYSIYMHDTPTKNLFSRPVRAFSHGCMRTENPVELARWLLIEVTGRLTTEKFDEVLESKKESAFGLDPKIPISTDYVNTGFDPEGRLVFYSDVYGFDRDYAEGKTPYAADPEHPNTLVFAKETP